MSESRDGAGQSGNGFANPVYNGSLQPELCHVRGIDGVDAPGWGWGNCTRISGLRSITTPAIAAGHGT